MRFTKEDCVAIEAERDIYNAALSFPDLLREAVAADRTKLRSNIIRRNPDKSPEEVDAILAIKKVCGASLDWKVYGTIRYALNTASDDLHAALAMLGRIGFYQRKLGEDAYTNIWSILPSLACCDDAAGAAWEANTCMLSAGQQETVALHNCVLNLLREQKPIDLLAPQFSPPSRGEAWIISLIDVLRSLSTGKSATINAAISKHLKHYAKRADAAPVSNIIPVELIGVLQGLLGLFNVGIDSDAIPGEIQAVCSDLRAVGMGYFRDSISSLAEPALVRSLVKLKPPLSDGSKTTF